MSENVPTSQEFEACCREAFGFLLKRGFSLESAGEFSRRLVGPFFDVIIQGEGYGTIASVSLTGDGASAVPLSRLVPMPERSRPPAGQLAQIQFYATHLQEHCADLLEGRTERLRQAQVDWARLLKGAKRLKPAG